MNKVSVGDTFTSTLKVSESLLVPALADHMAGMESMPRVLATPFLVAFIEWTCIQYLSGILSDGQGSVGTNVELTHSAPTPLGMVIRSEMQVTEVNGRAVQFKVLCFDEVGPIGKAQHGRYIMDRDRFEASLATRRIA